MDKRAKRNKVGRIVGAALLLGGLAMGTTPEPASASRPVTVKGYASCKEAKLAKSSPAQRVTVTPDRMGSHSARPGWNHHYSMKIPASGMWATIEVKCQLKTHYFRRILHRNVFGNSNHDFIRLS